MAQAFIIHRMIAATWLSDSVELHKVSHCQSLMQLAHAMLVHSSHVFRRSC